MGLTAHCDPQHKLTSLDDPHARIIQTETKSGTRIVLLVEDDGTEEGTVKEKRKGETFEQGFLRSMYYDKFFVIIKKPILIKHQPTV